MKKQDRTLRVLGLIFGLTALVALGALIGHYAFQTDQWNPLGEYPTQKVESKLVLPTGKVEVDATKCNATDKPVTVHGRSQWQSIYPLGTQVLGGEGTALREPGCAHFHYENPLPKIVIARAAEVCASTGTASSWQITGQETPVRASGNGVPRSYQTETFTIACVPRTVK